MSRATRPADGNERIVVCFKVPPVLRASFSGQKEVEATGVSVGAVLRDLVAEYPAAAGQVFREDGELNPYINVYLDGEDVRVLDGLDTKVVHGSEIQLLPKMGLC